jgi:transcriptional regulator with XRE-family HTH domain
MASVEAIAEARRMTRNPAACRTLRLGANVGLRELAEAIGVDAATLSRWERGERRPLTRHAIAWAAALRELSS